ncbi:MAG: glycosyltransferase family 4 protein [Prevotella sp.]|nr:glycosyltransferase family 4 protein [Prevotella sp.]
MTILYDYQAFCMQRYGGVSNCFVQLISHLPASDQYEISIAESDNIHLKASGLVTTEPMRLPCDRFLRQRKFKGQRTLYDLYGRLFPRKTSEGRNRLLTIDTLRKGQYDVFHPTFFDDYFLPYLGQRPFVLTVHDMIPEMFFPSYDPQVRKKRELVERAAHIVAVSAKTKEDLVRMFQIDERRVTVIHHGPPASEESASDKRLVEGKYLLYVGVRKDYKNFIPMLQELLPVLRQHQDIQLVCTGPDFTRHETDFFARNGIASRIVHVRPSDAEMHGLYAHALCFLFPSLYEGFGIPILEAYAASCPVLLNHASCFPEVAEDAALFFHLDSQGKDSDLAQVMQAFLGWSDDERQQLIQRQRQRLAAFSWQKAAAQLHHVYEEVLSRGSHG